MSERRSRIKPTVIVRPPRMFECTECGREVSTSEGGVSSGYIRDVGKIVLCGEQCRTRYANRDRDN